MLLCLGNRQKACFFMWGNFRFRVKVAERHASFSGIAKRHASLCTEVIGLGLKVAERHASFFRGSPKCMLLYAGEF